MRLRRMKERSLKNEGEGCIRGKKSGSIKEEGEAHEREKRCIREA